MRFSKANRRFYADPSYSVVQLPYHAAPASSSSTPAAAALEEDAGLWQTFIQRVQESIIHSFDLNFTSYEEEVRKVDAQRQIPGWNFCTFFIQKVCSLYLLRWHERLNKTLPGVLRKVSHILSRL